MTHFTYSKIILLIIVGKSDVKLYFPGLSKKLFAFYFNLFYLQIVSGFWRDLGSFYILNIINEVTITSTTFPLPYSPWMVMRINSAF